MTSLLTEFGVDEDDFEWQQLGTCYDLNTVGNMDNLNLFFDDYEADPTIAVQVDQMCLGCPVAKVCLQYGIETKSTGVWGGIYLKDGNTDKPRNLHKTDEIWKRLKNVHGN